MLFPELFLGGRFHVAWFDIFDATLGSPASRLGGAAARVGRGSRERAAELGRASGGKPAAAEYVQCFPLFTTELTQLFEPHQALGGEATFNSETLR